MTAFSGEFVRFEVDGGIATIRLDRPPMNVLSAAVQEEIRAAAAEAARRPDVAAVVVYGGEKVYAAGADVKEMVDMSYPDMVERSGHLQSAFSAVAAIGKPTVSAITGYALGGGCELALCTDFRVAGRSAKLGQPEIMLGIIPGAGGTQRLPRLIGPARAKDLIFSGRFVDAQEALAIGLVDGSWTTTQVYPAARDLVGRLRGRARPGPSRGQGGDRPGPRDRSGDRPGDRADGCSAALFATADRTAGMTSFIASGPGKAVFEGADLVRRRHRMSRPDWRRCEVHRSPPHAAVGAV